MTTTCDTGGGGLVPGGLTAAMAALAALGDDLGRHELRVLAAGLEQRQAGARERAERAAARIAAELARSGRAPDHGAAMAPGRPQIAPLAGKRGQAAGWVADGRSMRLLARLRAIQALLHETRNRRMATPSDVHVWVDDERGGRPGRVMWRGVELGPTPETLAHVPVSRVSPLPALYERGQLDDDQVRAAAQIAGVVEGMTRRLDARAAALQGAGGRGWADDVPARVAEAWSLVYVPWAWRQRAGEAAGRRHLGIVLAVCVGGCSVAAARLAARTGYDRALALLAAGLDDWSEMWAERRAAAEEVA